MKTRYTIPTPDWDEDADWIMILDRRKNGGVEPTRRHQGPGPHKSGTPQSVHGGGAARAGLPEGWTMMDGPGEVGLVAVSPDSGTAIMAPRGAEFWGMLDVGDDKVRERAVTEVANEIDSLEREYGRPPGGLLVQVGSNDSWEYGSVKEEPAGTTWPAANPVRMQINSRLWTDPSFRDRYSRARGDNLIATDAPIVRQVITHEYGHVAAGPGNRDVVVAMSAVRPGAEFQMLPYYARSDPAEAYAEAFAAHRLSSNPPEWAERIASMEGWDQL